jgi:hypothetical protein
VKVNRFLACVKGNMEEKTKELDLSNPKDCRWYLKNFTIGNDKGESSTVKVFETNDGRSLTVDKMTDSEAIQYANQLYNELDLPSQRSRMN